MIPTAMLRLQMLRHDRRSSSQIDIHPPRVLLRRVLQAELLAYLLDFGFYSLDVVG